MFSIDARTQVQGDRIALAQRDPEIVGAALVGSTGSGEQDAWSDIDLALRVSPEADRDRVMSRWIREVHHRHSAVDHFKVVSDGAVYVVFLLPDTLQIDISFWPYAEFRPTGQYFALVFGDSQPRRDARPAPDSGFVGQGWLFALHARSALARDRPWQAVYMINGLRDQVIAMACERRNLAIHHARGADDLPPDLRATLQGSLVRSLAPSALVNAFDVAVEGLLAESEAVNKDEAKRLRPVLNELVESARRAAGPR